MVLLCVSLSGREAKPVTIWMFAFSVIINTVLWPAFLCLWLWLSFCIAKLKTHLIDFRMAAEQCADVHSLGCFKLFTKTNPAMYNLLYLSLYTYLIISLEEITRCSIARSRVISKFRFKEKQQFFFAGFSFCGVYFLCLQNSRV